MIPSLPASRLADAEAPGLLDFLFPAARIP
jgi:hypothetical protein